MLMCLVLYWFLKCIGQLTKGSNQLYSSRIVKNWSTNSVVVYFSPTSRLFPIIVSTKRQQTLGEKPPDWGTPSVKSSTLFHTISSVSPPAYDTAVVSSYVMPFNVGTVTITDFIIYNSVIVTVKLGHFQTERPSTGPEHQRVEYAHLLSFKTIYCFFLLPPTKPTTLIVRVPCSATSDWHKHGWVQKSTWGPMCVRACVCVLVFLFLCVSTPDRPPLLWWNFYLQGHFAMYEMRWG